MKIRKIPKKEFCLVHSGVESLKNSLSALPVEFTFLTLLLLSLSLSLCLSLYCLVITPPYLLILKNTPYFYKLIVAL